MSGLTEAVDVDILNAQNAHLDLGKTILYYNSGSEFALDYQSYGKLVDTIKDKYGITLTALKSSTHVGGDNVWLPTYKTVFDLGALTDRNNGFKLWYKDMTTELSAEGKIKINDWRKSLELELDGLSLNNQDYLKGSVFVVKISRRRAGISVPENDKLSEMTVERQEELFRSDQINELRTLIYTLPGEEYEDIP